MPVLSETELRARQVNVLGEDIARELPRMASELISKIRRLYIKTGATKGHTRYEYSGSKVLDDAAITTLCDSLVSLIYNQTGEAIDLHIEPHPQGGLHYHIPGQLPKVAPASTREAPSGASGFQAGFSLCKL